MKLELGQMRDMSIDDIINLYRSGYSLEDKTQLSLSALSNQSESSSSIQELQLPSLETSGLTFAAGAISGLFLMFMLRGKIS